VDLIGDEPELAMNTMIAGGAVADVVIDLNLWVIDQNASRSFDSQREHQVVMDLRTVPA
jgi:hypothetical protein